MRPLGSQKKLEQRRKHAISLLVKGVSPVRVAEQMSVDGRSLRRWIAAYRRDGENGVAAKPAPGRPGKLSREIRDLLAAVLLMGPRACGYGTDLWTCALVRHMIQQQFGISYHVNHIGRFLGSLGFSPQRTVRVIQDRNGATVHKGFLPFLSEETRKTPVPEVEPAGSR